MAMIYRYSGEPSPGSKPHYEQFEGEVIATRDASADHGATAYLIVDLKDGWYQVVYCFARKTGSYEHAVWCDAAPQFKTRAEAIAHTAAKAARNGHVMQ